MPKEFSISVVLAAVDRVTGVVDKVVGKTTHALHKIEEAGEKLHERMEKAMNIPVSGAILGLAAEFLTIEKLSEGYKECTEAAEEQATAQARLNVLMSNTKGGSLEAAKAATEYADKVEALTAINHKATMAMEGQLATYNLTPAQIQKSVLPLMGYAEKMSHGVATTEDATGAAKALGRALISPTLSLVRMGIAVDASDKKMLKHATTAQKLAFILPRLQQHYKGLTAAMAGSSQGQQAQLQNKLEGLKEDMGTPLLKLNIAATKLAITAIPLLIPAVEKLTVVLEKGVNWITMAINKTSAWAKANPALAALIEKVVIAAVAFVALLGPMLKVLKGVEWVIEAFKKFGPWIKNVIEWGGRVIQWIARLGPWMTGLIEWFTAAGEIIAEAGVTVETLSALFPALGGAIAVLSGPIGWVVAAVVALIAVTILVVTHWNKVKAFFVGLFKFLLGDSPFAKLLRYINPVWMVTFLLIKNWDKVKAWFTGFKNWFIQLWQDILNSPAFQAFMSNWADVEKGASMVGQAVGKAWNWATTDPDAPQTTASIARPGGHGAANGAPGRGGHSTVDIRIHGAPHGTRSKSSLAPGHTFGMGYTNSSVMD